MKRTGYLMLGTLMLALAGCGQDDNLPDPMQGYVKQDLKWASCDNTVLGVDATQMFSLLGERLKCAEMDVPLDWAHPERAKATMYLLRVKASDEKQRQGSLFFNPGGPGGDGLSLPVWAALMWGEAKTPTPESTLLKQIPEQYDLIGFSPRGVGNSSRLTCEVNELAPAMFIRSDTSNKNQEAMLRVSQLMAKGCQRNPLTPFINTDATVRDLELARQLLKEEKFNYVGYSYGTWLGSWYAKIFPKNVGRMLLDSNTAWSEGMQTGFENKPMATERAFRDRLSPYLAQHNDFFSLGDTQDKVYNQYTHLDEPIREFIGYEITHQLYDRDFVTMGLTLRGAQIANDLIKQNPKMNDDDLVLEVNKSQYFKDPDLDQKFKLTVAEIILTRTAVMKAGLRPIVIPSVSESIRCNDDTWNTNPDYWKELNINQAKKYPLFGGFIISNIACIYWKGGPTVKKPSLPENMPPLLMTQTEYDLATYREGAFTAFEATPSAKMIYVTHESKHGVFPYGTACVDTPIAHYFLTGELPKDRQTTCEGLPQPGEKFTTMSTRSSDLSSLTVITRPNGERCLGTSSMRAQAQTETVAERAAREYRRILEANALGAAQFKGPKVSLAMCDNH